MMSFCLAGSADWRTPTIVQLKSFVAIWVWGRAGQGAGMYERPRGRELGADNRQVRRIASTRRQRMAHDGDGARLREGVPVIRLGEPGHEEEKK